MKCTDILILPYLTESFIELESTDKSANWISKSSEISQQPSVVLNSEVKKLIEDDIDEFEIPHRSISVFQLKTEK